MLFGSADTDDSFSVEDLGEQWLGPTSLLTSPDPDEDDEHNMWNPMLGLFCHVQVGVFVESFFNEVVLGRSALSFHFALDLPCDKAESHHRPTLRLAIAASLPFWSTRLGRLV